MARKSKKNDADPLMLLLAIPVAIIGFFQEHIWLAILLGIILVVSIIAIIAAKKAKRAAYLRWYYDRDRRIAELNINEKFDTLLTNAILKAVSEGKVVSVGKTNSAFESVKEAYRLAIQSNEIFSGNDALSGNDSGRALNSALGIKPTQKPMVIRCTGENNGGYVFYVFAETILAFVEGPEQVVFLAAYKPEALKISCREQSVPKTMVVHEKTQYDIRYYDKFSPVRDAEIISSRWEVINKDGSRSFKGGLLPEHNPLHFNLRYGKTTFSIGNYSISAAFSRYKPAMTLVVAHENYKKSLSQTATHSDLTNTLNKVIDKKMQETAKATPKEDTATNLNSIFTAVDTKETTVKETIPSVFTSTEKPVVVTEATTSTNKKPISVDDARYRNRMVANNIIKELNHTYHGKHEFKVYQVRKDREDWAMQDAGVYTYIVENGIQYAIEFNLRTNTSDGTTNLEFFIWCDSASQTQKKFAAIINKNSMQQKSTGYNVILSKDYQGNENDMSKEIIPVISLLFADVANL